MVLPQRRDGMPGFEKGVMRYVLDQSEPRLFFRGLIRSIVRRSRLLTARSEMVFYSLG